MSSSGATYYDKELKYLYCLLKNLPNIISEGNAHNFTNYIPDPQKTKDFGCMKSMVSQALKSSFSWCGTPTGETITVSFKSRSPLLEEVVTVLCHHITGNGGMNLLLMKWVDYLTAGVRVGLGRGKNRQILQSGTRRPKKLYFSSLVGMLVRHKPHFAPVLPPYSTLSFCAS
ncbi:hypothetical protein DFH08DRAFT_814247 [Mycena albidolilacea]|uniref:Uncharacterized protein n=1 Tax=Mycena albidolilacea TaxID=1033008 RepID=A0AAD6ZQI6_9AGAR|nr:hypothetical protein DFH08DRAFT_814247 [Mycena albidolilacea]